jgi:hypothetical protein
MTKEKNMNIKDETFNVIANELVFVDGKYTLLENMSDIEFMVSNENVDTVKSKVYSFLEKLNNLTEEEAKELLNSDFQNEVYDKI